MISITQINCLYSELFDGIHGERRRPLKNRSPNRSEGITLRDVFYYTKS